MSRKFQYTNKLIEILQSVVVTQDQVLDDVARACVDTVQNGHLIHLFGSGHSVIPALDAFPRYGSFVGLNPLTDPRLMWHNVLGPGGVRELLWLERTENYIDKFLDHEPLTSGDFMICYSHGGTNAAAIEAAMYAKKLGIKTAAVTSSASAAAVPVRHSTGSRLSDVCDFVIDTGAPVQDAIVEIPGWDRPTGGSSTVLAAVISHEIITRTAAICGERGVQLPTFVSPTVPGASVESNDGVFVAHAQAVAAAHDRKLAEQS